VGVQHCGEVAAAHGRALPDKQGTMPVGCVMALGFGGWPCVLDPYPSCSFECAGYGGTLEGMADGQYGKGCKDDASRSRR